MKKEEDGKNMKAYSFSWSKV